MGLLSKDPLLVLPEGSVVVEPGKYQGNVAAAGHVTSSYFSPNLERSIALALVAGGRNRIGEEVDVVHMGQVLTAKIMEPRFL